jgi:hypothetical protein
VCVRLLSSGAHLLSAPLRSPKCRPAAADRMAALLIEEEEREQVVTAQRKVRSCPSLTHVRAPSLPVPF